MKAIKYTRPEASGSYFPDPEHEHIIQTGFSSGRTFIAYQDCEELPKDMIELYSIEEVEDVLALVQSWYPEDEQYFSLGEDGKIIDNRPMEDFI